MRYPALTALVLGTANHYLLDVLAGVALWAVARGLVRWFTMLGVTGTRDVGVTRPGA